MRQPPTPEQCEQIQAALHEDPSQLAVQLARFVGVPEAAVIRLLPDGCSTELDATRWQEIFDLLAETGKVHVVVSNTGVTCEVVGEFGGFSTWGEFFNVQTDTLDLHIRWRHLTEVFAVRRPTLRGGRTLSVQFFDEAGQAVMKVFLNFAGQPTPQREEQFEEFRRRFGSDPSASG
ncbi:MAG: ChuX/HutX family heme-like substrate-binding protein [Gemmataceae bacterium]